MNARFRVNSVFAISSRSIFVLSGVVTEGIVHKGDYLCAPFNLGVPIIGVELVLLRTWKEEPALAFQYRSPDELALWESIDWVGQELEVVESPAAAGPALKMSNDR